MFVFFLTLIVSVRLCELCDSEVLFRNYHVFEYSATNINRRDAEFAETWKFTLLPALEKKGSSLFCMGELESLVLCVSVPQW
ncbi:MAG: hypothetical protein PHH39_04410, partial [Methanothrix soehngenii]|nr:hypothetical protein [Methanothrix soehngenii]